MENIVTKANVFSSASFIKSSTKVFIFMIYFLFILGSSYILYKSYQHYEYLNGNQQYQQVIEKVSTLEGVDKALIQNDIEVRKNEQILIMITASLVLVLMLFIFFRKKQHSTDKKLENENLKRLLEELDNHPDQEKAERLKSLLKEKDSSEMYTLISEIIEELHDNQEVANEANKTKSLFLANMSHEIRTPLNGIIGFTKFLTSTGLNEEQHEFVKIIRKSSEDLLAIINNILDISKIENGHVELEEIFFNPMEEFENVIESYAANASKKDIDFSLWIDPHFSTLLLRSDPGKIKQVLINLISNAVKFTDKKGAIDVIIERVDSSEEKISVQFTVKDTGVGISKENEEKVFEAFTQAESTTSRKYGGTGLGLTISAGLVNELGGALRVDSVLGEGSSFFFTLEMPMREVVERTNTTQALKLGLYSPNEVQLKDSDRYLEDYLLSFNPDSIMRFKTFEECLEADPMMFDAVYIHYDKINKEELKTLVKHYQHYSNIVLLTKLNKRHLVQDIDVDFTQVMYEPITFSKVEKTFKYLIENKKTKKIVNIKQITVDEEESEKTLEKGNEDMKRFSGIHALVVEDNPINQKMIQHTLKNLGITTECAENGKVGFEMYMRNHESYDVVFMDIQMPVMNGIESTQSIKAFVSRNNLTPKPIIAVTANALKGDREHFMSEGLDEYVSKPIDLEKFITVLKLFFKESEVASTLPKVSKTDILLYKETAMEAKIISAILHRLDYSVDVVDNLDELKEVMDVNSYKCILLDKVHSEIEHLNITQYIKRLKTPTLLFVDANHPIVPSDQQHYTFIIDKVTDYTSIKTKVDHMISMAKAS
jgi:signal transduction histidine kinase/CheY-like chemotaxis protein